MIAKCECEHCGTPIEFSTDEFLSGSQQACPACGAQTTLSVATPSKPAKPQPKEPAPPVALSSARIAVASSVFPPAAGSGSRLRLLNTFLLLAIGVELAYLAWPKPAVPARYDVEAFKWENDSGRHKSQYGGNTYQTMVTLLKFDGMSVEKSYPINAYGPEDVLDRIGDDGWQFVWTDGKNFLVQRPAGKWLYDSFIVFDQEDTNSPAK